jgi:hypothetical protein
VFMTIMGSICRLEISRNGVLEKGIGLKQSLNWSDIHSLRFVSGLNPTIEIVLTLEYSLANPLVKNPYKLAGCYGVPPIELVKLVAYQCEYPVIRSPKACLKMIPRYILFIFKLEFTQRNHIDRIAPCDVFKLKT